jgi:hypothetical protein
MWYQEVCTWKAIGSVHFQIYAVRSSADTSNASEPPSAEPCYTTIQSPSRLVESVKRMVRHGFFSTVGRFNDNDGDGIKSGY